MRAILLPCLLLLACSSKPTTPACAAPLPPTHLIESFCTDGSGYCLFDHEIPF